MIKRLFGSRKIVLLLAGTTVAIAARLGLQLDTELVLGILTIVGVTIGAIGYEDGQAKGAGGGLDPARTPQSSPPPTSPT